MFSYRATMAMSWRVSSAWMCTPSLKFRLSPVEEGHHQGIAGPEAGHQFLPAAAFEGVPAGYVGEDQLGPDAVLGQEPELGVQVIGIVVGLGDAGVAVGHGQHGHGESPLEGRDGLQRVSNKRAFLDTSHPLPICI